MIDIDKVATIHALDQPGLLVFRGSPKYVAQLLGVSRASFYNLLKDSRLDKTTGQSNSVIEKAE